MYALLVSAELVVVEVVDDDVVWSSLAVTQSTRRLSTPTSEELDSAFGLELPLLPVAVGLLKAEVGDDALVGRPKSAMMRWLNCSSACMSPSSRSAASSDFPTMTMKLMSRLGWNMSQSGMKMSKWVDLA